MHLLTLWLTIFLLPTTLIAYLLFDALRIYLRNLRDAKASGFKYLRTPVYEYSTFAHLVYGTEAFCRLIRALPFGWGDKYWFRINYHWQWRQRGKNQKQLGEETFAIVSPGDMLVITADPEIVWQISTQRGLWHKPSHFYDVFRIYGENVLSAEHDAWLRHRKLVSGVFNEINNALVWKEAINQGTQMLEQWTKPSPSTEVRRRTTAAGKTEEDVAIVRSRLDTQKWALHIISSAGFGADLPFTPDANSKAYFSDIEPAPGCAIVYRDAINLISTDLVFIFAMSQIWSRRFMEWAPKAVQKALHVHHDTGYYLRSLIGKARQEVQEGNAKHNLLTSVIRQHQTQQQGNLAGFSKDWPPITDVDIEANAFIFSLAGHETTAVALRHILILLALYPEKQKWFHTQLDEALVCESDDPADWNYETLFPKLIGPACVINETLRVFPPVLMFHKKTPQGGSVRYRGKEHVLPRGAIIGVHIASLHINAEYWGPTATSFKPEMWDGRYAPAGDVPAFRESTVHVRYEEGGLPRVHQPVKGAFVPFAEGNRACIGRKFAQVELCVVLAVLLRKRRVELVPREGESRRELEERVWGVIESAKAVLTLQVPDEIPLRMVLR